jgi:anti-anti-sigma factor
LDIASPLVHNAHQGARRSLLVDFAAAPPEREARRAADTASAAGAGFLVTLTWLGPEALLVVIGGMDDSTAHVLRHRVEEALARPARRITMDVSQLTFVGAAGCDVLRHGAGALRARGGDLVVFDPPPSVHRILERAGLAAELTIATGFGRS